MMDTFKLYFSLGLDYILNIRAYNHIIFLIVLVTPRVFKDWKYVFWLVTTFTIGHTFSLFLATFGILRINSNFVEFLIPITIIITAFYGILTSEKKYLQNNFGLFFLAPLFFGVVHGLGSSGYFRQIIASQNNKILSILEFALGIEAAQLIIGIVILILSSLSTFIFNISRRDWVLIASSIVIGMCISMILGRI